MNMNGVVVSLIRNILLHLLIQIIAMEDGHLNNLIGSN